MTKKSCLLKLFHMASLLKYISQFFHNSTQWTLLRMEKKAKELRRGKESRVKIGFNFLIHFFHQQWHEHIIILFDTMCLISSWIIMIRWYFCSNIYCYNFFSYNFCTNFQIPMNFPVVLFLKCFLFILIWTKLWQRFFMTVETVNVH